MASYYMLSFMSDIFHLANVFPRCSMFQYFIPCYGWMVGHYVNIFICSPVHQLLDIWVVSSFWLSEIMLLLTLTCRFSYEHMFSILLNIYLGVELLDHIMDSFALWTFKLYHEYFLMFWKTFHHRELSELIE